MMAHQPAAAKSRSEFSRVLADRPIVLSSGACDWTV
jgi:hypothetical protein